MSDLPNGGPSSNGGVAETILNAPLGLTAMRIFLWLISVAALYGALTLLVLRPSLVSMSESSGPSESVKTDNRESLEGAVCSFPTTLEN
jgi:hypothetical protein